jgi:hypothetical protein
MQLTRIGNLTFLSLIGGLFIQLGAQLFALLIIVRTLIKVPPESLAILQGPYGYDSSIYWDVFPNITFILFVVAIISNWKNGHRNWILSALALYFIAGLCAIFVVGSLFTQLTKGELQVGIIALANKWYACDWLVWLLTLASGLLLMIRLNRYLNSKQLTD